MVRLASVIALSLAAGIGASQAGTPCAWNWQCGGRCGSQWRCEDAGDGVRCALHGDCRSKYCTWKFKCARQLKNYEYLGYPLVDYRPCESDWGRCGYCLPHGAKLKNGMKCTYDADCIEGVCGKDGHPTINCAGTCRQKMNDNEKCDNDVNCKSGFCSSVWGNFGRIDEKGDIDTGKELLETFIQRCRPQKDLREYVGHNSLFSNSEECKSKSAVCGYCAPRGRKNWNKNGHWCGDDSDCESRLCFPNDWGFDTGCRGKCGVKKDDGQSLGWSIHLITGGDSVPYHKFCKSGRGVCGVCQSSRKNPPGGKCADSADCEAGSYCGRTNGNHMTTKFCNGVCKKKKQDNEECDFWPFDGGDLWEGESEACVDYPRSICRVLGSLKTGKWISQVATCQPRDGGREKAPCMVDSHCGKDFYCKDGNFINGIGECASCPYYCGKHEGFPRGCNMCANKEENMECGERTWGEETKCAFEQAPTVLADVFTAYHTCLATGGMAGVHDRDKPRGATMKDLIGDQDMLTIGKKCMKSADDCKVELFHTKEFKMDDTVANMLEHMAGRRLLASEQALVAEGPADEMIIKAMAVKQSARRTFGFGSRRRLQEDPQVAQVDLDTFGGKSIEEIIKGVPSHKRAQYKEDMKEFCAARKAVLSAERGVQESANYDGDVAVDNKVDLVFDPDFVLNPRKSTLKGTVGVTGSINGKINFEGNSKEGGKLKIAKPLMGAMPLVSQVINTGYIPIYIELFFQPVIEIEATMDAPVDASLAVNGNIVYNGNVDVDLSRAKGDRFRLTEGKGSMNSVDIDPSNFGDKAIQMKIKARVVARFVFLLFTTSGVQIDHGLQVNAELNLRPQAAPADGTESDCLEGDFAVTDTSLVIRPVFVALSVDPGRAVHGACLAAVYSAFSLFSLPGLAMKIADCHKKAWLKKSDQATLMEMCDNLKMMPDVIDTSENMLSFTPGYLTIYNWKLNNLKTDFHFCEGVDQYAAGTHLG